MRITILSLLTLVSVSVFSQEITFDSAAENLKANVKSIDYKSYKVRKDGSEHLKYFKRYQFDRRGHLVEKINFGYDNQPDSRELYKYQNLHLTEVNVLKSTGKKDKTTRYDYDNTGKLRRITKTNYSGDVEYEILYEYDTRGRLIKKEKNIPSISYTLTESFVYNNDIPKPVIKHKKTRIGSTKETYKYDEQNRLIEKSEYNAVGELYNTIKYSYNEKGDKISLDKYDDKGNKTYWETYVYQYDDKGNWTQKTTYKKGEKFSVEKREITYY